MIRPMLGVNAELDKLVYPVYASTKLDGVRAVITKDGVFSRSGKPIPNDYTRGLLKKYVGLDGELIVGNPTDTDVYRNTVSGVMTKEGTPDVKFYCFDCWNSLGGINKRYDELITIAGLNNDAIQIVEQVFIDNEEHLLNYEEHCLSKGYEGIIIRNPDAEYKFGRSTVKQASLLKLKRFMDAEAEIIGYTNRFHNQNEATKNAIGYTERSTAKSGMLGVDTLGSLTVCMETDGEPIIFSIGSGFTDSLRDELWDDKDNLIGKIVKFKYFAVGVKDRPRFPIFLGFRDKRDM